jgi:hypothetical protein
MLGIEKLYSETNVNVMPWIKAYADNFTETKTDFFEMRNASYKSSRCVYCQRFLHHLGPVHPRDYRAEASSTTRIAPFPTQPAAYCGV